MEIAARIYIVPLTALDDSTLQAKKLRLKYNVKYKVYNVKEKLI